LRRASRNFTCLLSNNIFDGLGVNPNYQVVFVTKMIVKRRGSYAAIMRNFFYRDFIGRFMREQFF